jgi:hypothetical protein
MFSLLDPRALDRRRDHARFDDPATSDVHLAPRKAGSEPDVLAAAVQSACSGCGTVLRNTRAGAVRTLDRAPSGGAG